MFFDETLSVPGFSSNLNENFDIRILSPGFFLITIKKGILMAPGDLTSIPPLKMNIFGSAEKHRYKLKDTQLSIAAEVCIRKVKHVEMFERGGP